MRCANLRHRFASPRRLWALGSILVLLCTLVLGGAVDAPGDQTQGPLIADDGSKTDPDFG